MSETFGRCVASDHDGLHVQDDGCDNWQPQHVYGAEPSHYEQLLAEVQTWRTRAESTAGDIAAWLLDRADQYETDDPIWVGIADLAKGVARGDAQEAAKHGELDADLYSRLGIVLRPSSVQAHAGHPLPNQPNRPPKKAE